MRSDLLDPARPLLGDADLGRCGESLISLSPSVGKLWLLPGLSLVGELDVDDAMGIKICPPNHGLTAASLDP